MLKTLIGSALFLSVFSFAPKLGSGSIASEPFQEPSQGRIPSAGSVLLLGSMDVFETALVDALGTAQVNQPNVIILPQASEGEGRGLVEKRAFEDIGITDVYVLEDLSADGARDLLGLATVIWLGEGSPKRLMQSLAANNFASYLPQLNDRGAILGGAGRVAGALGIGYIEGNIKPPVMTSLSVMPNRGMGLWNGFVIPCVDEDNRLIVALTACLDQPNRPCLTLNHGSVVRINGDDMSFWGPGASIFIDARKAKKGPIDAKAPLSVRDVKLHSFTEGETFTWFQ